MLTGLLSFLSLSSAGLFPGLMREVATHAEEKELVSQLVKHALLLVACFTTVLFACVLLVLHFVPFEYIYGGALLQYREEILTASVVSALCVVMQVVGGVGEAAQTGLQRQHINTFWSVVGSIISLILLAISAKIKPEMWFLVIAIHGSVAACKMINLIFVLAYEVKEPLKTLFQPLRSQVIKNLGYVSSILFVAQIAILVNQQSGIYFVGRMAGAVEAANFAIMLRIIAIGGGFISMFTTPLSPALSEAVYKGDVRWIESRLRKFVLIISAIGIGGGAVIMIFGKLIVGLWLGTQINLSSELFYITGLYFIVVVLNHFCFIVLVAFQSTVYPTLVVVAEAVMLVVLTVIYARDYGALGVLSAHLVSAGLLGIPLNFFILRQKLIDFRSLAGVR